MYAATFRSQWIVLACALALSGCGSALPTATPPSPTVVPSLTPTIFFPTLVPAATITPLPNPTTSPDLADGAGPLLFQAGFAPDEGWLLSSDTDGAASLSEGSLVIAVSRPRASRYVLVPMPPTADFLVETTIQARLCDADDEVGLLFRVGAQQDHYRYTLSCSGIARMTRILGASAIVLAGPAEASSAIPGSPAENRLAVLARGQSFTFFVNGVEVLQSHDSQLPSGGLAVFVRSASQGQTTAAVTLLTVWALQPATATFTPGSG